jgi:hypothetical protein
MIRPPQVLVIGAAGRDNEYKEEYHQEDDTPGIAPDDAPPA